MVNTIHKEGDKLIGYNTDVFGFQLSLLKLMTQMNWRGNSALILGTGGASKAVIWVLSRLQIPYKTVSRIRGSLLYEQLTYDIVHNHHLIVNTTPLGMHPYEDQMPDIPLDALGSYHIVYDLIYNPQKSLLLRKADSLNATIFNGSEMLLIQAEKSWSIWNR